MARIPARTGPDGDDVLRTLGVTRVVPIRDNKPFIERFDPAAFSGIVARPVKNVVVGQEPQAGEFVPAGTPINVKLTVKDVIPIESFPKFEPTVISKYQNKSVGDLLADVAAAGVAEVFEKDQAADYDRLPLADKQKVNTFIKTKLGVDPDDPAVDKEKVKKIYSDVKLAHDF
jgi:hypothetical protein